MAPLIVSSFGIFVRGLFQGLFTAPSGQTFLVLACGWALAGERPTITRSLGLTGATTVKHFSQFYVFLGHALYRARWQLWARLIRHAAAWVPAEAPLGIELDDSTKKKAGSPSEGVDRYRHGAGSARQDYRTLRGLNLVGGIMRVPLPQWPGHSLRVPLGLSLYLTETQAAQLHLPYRTRSALARESSDFVAAQLPARQLRVRAEGGYATKEVLRTLPASVDVGSHLLLPGQLYALPHAPVESRPGRPPKKGPGLGSPKTLARKRSGWQPQPTEAGATVQAWDGLWPAVLPGRPRRVVGIRRPLTTRRRKPGQRKPPPPVEAVFTTDLTLTLAAILAQYRARWAVEITIRDSYAFAGLGQDQGRKVARVVGANTLGVVLAAARTLWFVAHARHAKAPELRRYRPWYRHKCAPSQLDIVWACREALHEAGVFPILRFAPALAETPEETENTLPLAA